MLIRRIEAQLARAQAFARLSVQSIIDAIRTGIKLTVTGSPMVGEQPRMALIPVDRRRGSVCGRHNPAVTGATYEVNSPYAADPASAGWRVPAFGNTDTGKTGHSQPSRFAP